MEPLRNAEVDRLLFELTQPAGRRPLLVLRGLAANGSDRARRGRRDRADPLRRLSCGTARSTLRPGRPRRAVHVDRLAERERVPGPLDAEHEHTQRQPAAAHAAAAGRQQGLDRTQGRAVARPGGRDWWTPCSIKSMAAATSSTPSPSRCRSPSSGSCSECPRQTAPRSSHSSATGRSCSTSFLRRTRTAALLPGKPRGS